MKQYSRNIIWGHTILTTQLIAFLYMMEILWEYAGNFQEVNGTYWSLHGTCRELHMSYCVTSRLMCTVCACLVNCLCHKVQFWLFNTLSIVIKNVHVNLPDIFSLPFSFWPLLIFTTYHNFSFWPLFIFTTFLFWTLFILITFNFDHF